MAWRKQLWGLKGTDYYPGPNGEKLYTRWKKSEGLLDKYLLEICEIKTNSNYGRVTNFEIYQDKSTAHCLGRESREDSKGISAIICENFEHYSTLKKRPMKKEELDAFFNIFSSELEDFPADLRDGIIKDLKEYCLFVGNHLK
ncbi:hypothetical protein HYT26_03145 [Candidatus Pacearchaeota archaeon]|nr:hypothetical protein [Candidatus Pacearchaeota archaeon]